MIVLYHDIKNNNICVLAMISAAALALASSRMGYEYSFIISNSELHAPQRLTHENLQHTLLSTVSANTNDNLDWLTISSDTESNSTQNSNPSPDNTPTAT